MIHRISSLAALLAFIMSSMCSYAQPATAQHSPRIAPARLLSMSRLHYNGESYTLDDSTYYRYHGTRSGHYDEAAEMWVWDYDTCVPIVFTGWSDTWMYSKQYDGAGNCVRELTSRKSSTDLVWRPESAIEFGYDADNIISSELRTMWNSTGATMDPLSRSAYSYSADNKASAIGHRALSLPIGDSSTTHYVYDAAGRISFIYHEAFNPALSTTMPVNARIYTYDAAGDRVSQTFVWWNGSAWDTSERYTYSDFTDHLPATVVREVKDTVFKKMDRAHYTYSAHGLPLFVYYDWWNGSVWAVDTMAPAIRYHYQEMPNAVNDATPTITDISVYPVPAHDILTIAVNREATESATLSVTDMQGRVWMSLPLTAGKKSQHIVPIGELPQGNYNVVLKSRTGNVSRQIGVVR